MNRRIVVLVPLIAGIVAASTTARAEDAPAAAAEPLFATVNGKTITQKDFQGAYANYLRDTYYHREVPQDRIEEARKEVADRLIDRTLLIGEAKRRGLVADEKIVEQTIAGYDARYGASEMWQKGRAKMLPGLRQHLVEQDLLRQIETLGHAAPEPTDEAVRAYYTAHPERFTEPEKQRLHTIVLKVDPSSSKAVWDAAREEATRLVARLRSGEGKFEDLASLHSQDRSADNGGDMGYLHRGMIPEPVQAQIDERPLGSVGDPIDVLEGVAIFRLDERIPSKLQPFERVTQRARDLLKREQTQQAWDSFIAALRKTAVIQLAEPAAPATTKN